MIRASINLANTFARLDNIAVAAKAGAREAAQAGAQVFYEEMRARVPVSDVAHYFYGRDSRKTGVRYFFSPGNLRDSIYQYRLRYDDDGGRSTYVISWNRRKAPYGHMVEFGTSKAAAHPFLRPTYDFARGPAVVAANRALAERLKEGANA